MTVHTFDYAFHYAPAAPVLQVEVSGVTGASQTLLALVDSGADATLLPTPLLQRLRAPRVDARVLRTVTDERKTVSLYRISLRIGPYRLSNVRAVGVATLETAILGRDVLNQLIVTLNGLAAVTEVSQ